MAYLPLNAKSEFVAWRNFSDGSVFDSTRRFHDASAASIRPARRPTRGSGDGGEVVSPACGGVEPCADSVDGATAESESSAIATAVRERTDNRVVMGYVSRG